MRAATTLAVMAMGALVLTTMAQSLVHAVPIVVQTAYATNTCAAGGSALYSGLMYARTDGTCATFSMNGVDASVQVDCASGLYKLFPNSATCQGSVAWQPLGTCADMHPWATLTCEEADPSTLMYGTARKGPGCTGEAERNVLFQAGRCTSVGSEFAVFTRESATSITDRRFPTYPCTSTPTNISFLAFGVCGYSAAYNASITYLPGSPYPPTPSPVQTRVVVQTYFGNNDATCTGVRDYSRVVYVKPDGACAAYPYNGKVGSLKVNCNGGTFSLYENSDSCTGTSMTYNMGQCANFHPYATLACEDVDTSSLIVGDVYNGMTCAKPSTATLVYQTGRCSSVGTALAIFTSNGTTLTQALYPSYPCVGASTNVTTGIKLGVCNVNPTYNVSVVFRLGSLFTNAPTTGPTSGGGVGVAATAMHVFALVAAAVAMMIVGA